MIERIEWELLEANTVRAVLVIRAVLHKSMGESPAPRLTGVVRGPHCESAHTLPCEFMLKPDAEQPLTAIVTIADPCYWTDDIPMLYKVAVELSERDAVVASHREDIGLKRPKSETIDEIGLN